MKREVLNSIAILIIAVCLSFLIGTIIYDRHHNDPNTPFYEKFETDLQHPDTAQVIWDRGVMFVMFKTSHTVDIDTVEEDNQ